MGRFLDLPKWRTRCKHRPNTRRANKLGSCGYCTQLIFEALEARTLLSVSLQLPAGWEAHPMVKADLTKVKPADNDVSAPYGLTPNQIRGAYGLGSYTSGMLINAVTFGGIQGDGRGQTIAIVDAYDDPTA